MEYAKIFNQIINFRNVSKIRCKLYKEKGYKNSQTNYPDTENMCVYFYVLYIGNKYEDKISTVFEGVNYKDEESFQIYNKKFERFLESFQEYIKNNVCDCD